jgi:hypothetical protein
MDRQRQDKLNLQRSLLISLPITLLVEPEIKPISDDYLRQLLMVIDKLLSTKSTDKYIVELSSSRRLCPALVVKLPPPHLCLQLGQAHMFRDDTNVISPLRYFRYLRPNPLYLRNRQE